MQPEAKKLLADALKAAIAIEDFSRGRSFFEMASDNLFRSGVYWQFVVIGEALAQLRRIDEAAFDRVSESPRIVAFRNQIAHGYDVIQDSVTWQIIQDKLPILRRELEQLLEE